MPDVDATIAILSASPASTVLLVDYDGTLSPIVASASDARPLGAAIDQLGRLARVLGRVGVVSGRPVGFLTENAPIPGAVLTGLYGMEHVTDGIRSVDPRVEPYLGAVARTVAELQSRFPSELVEPKSGVCVTLHWRPAPERADEMLAAARELAAEHGLALLETRMAVELRPPIDVDKGDATSALIAGFGVAAFAGDDTGDLPAFAALAAAQADGRLQRAVRIGVMSPEAPAELAAVTDIVVDGPVGFVDLLARLADEIG